jgi:hypothetical protein
VKGFVRVSPLVLFGADHIAPITDARRQDSQILRINAADPDNWRGRSSAYPPTARAKKSDQTPLFPGFPSLVGSENLVGWQDQHNKGRL